LPNVTSARLKIIEFATLINECDMYRMQIDSLAEQAQGEIYT